MTVAQYKGIKPSYAWYGTQWVVNTCDGQHGSNGAQPVTILAQLKVKETGSRVREPTPIDISNFGLNDTEESKL